MTDNSRLMAGMRSSPDSSVDQTTAEEEWAEEPFEDWVEEWWENGPKQWFEASLKGQAHGPFQVWVEGWREGRTEGARQILVAVGTGRFGPPNARTHTTLAVIGNDSQPHALAERMATVSSWDELLASK